MLTGAIVGVLGAMVWMFLQRLRANKVQPRIRNALSEAPSLTLPELAVRLGLKDSFTTRGSLMAQLNPMVASGELVQEEPPGTTVANRLSVLRFRLASRATSATQPASV